MVQTKSGCSSDQSEQLLFYDIWKFGWLGEIQKNCEIFGSNVKFFWPISNFYTTEVVRLGPRNTPAMNYNIDLYSTPNLTSFFTFIYIFQFSMVSFYNILIIWSWNTNNNNYYLAPLEIGAPTKRFVELWSLISNQPLVIFSFFKICISISFMHWMSMKFEWMPYKRFPEFYS